MAAYIIVSVIAYLIGSISFAVIFSRKFGGFDVRDKGSGNAGTTNVLRSVGKQAAVITLICDILKGAAAVLIAILAAKIWKEVNPTLLAYAAGLFVILGHTFPIFFEFRGGKGIATAMGVLLVLSWEIALICIIFALILIAITRMVSIGSVLAAILFPILTIFMAKAGIGPILISIVIALLVIFNHRANLVRIKNGTENKLGQKAN
ncbi:MAG: glycerol-3-phosphate 1-O-acyltransferase PlsY [Firmicutes bacterium]|nr:glycerol-3-phosphate 1-O-acyltransferase PlsY [Bacillota bacterium]